MNVLELPKFSSKQIQLYNSIVGKRRRAGFTMGEKPFEMVFCLKPEGYNPTVFFKLQLSDQSLWMGLSEFPALEQFSPQFKDIALEKLESEVRNILLETVFDSVLSIAEEGLGIPVKINEFRVDPKPDYLEEVVYFKVQLKDSHTHFYGHFTFDRVALQFLGSLLGAFGAIPSNVFEEVPVPCRVMIGEETIGAREFRKLTVRDIILFAGKPFFTKGECQVSIAGKLFFLATYKSGSITLRSIMEKDHEDEIESSEEHEAEAPEASEEPEEHEASEEHEEPEEHEEQEEVEEQEVPEKKDTRPPVNPARAAAPQAPVAPVVSAEASEDLEEAGELTAQLPVRLVFEIGEKRIALKELRNIQPGFAFELASPVEKPVTIRANGVVVGTGELIQVGDRVGVRVVSFKK